MKDIFNDINFTLEQWGLWAVDDSGVAGYGRFIHSDNQAANDPCISDEDALKVDKAITALHRRHKNKAEAVLIYYRVRGCDHSKLAERLGTSLFKAKRELLGGVKFIDGYLSAMNDD